MLLLCAPVVALAAPPLAAQIKQNRVYPLVYVNVAPPQQPQETVEAIQKLSALMKEYPKARNYAVRWDWNPPVQSWLPEGGGAIAYSVDRAELNYEMGGGYILTTSTFWPLKISKRELEKAQTELSSCSPDELLSWMQKRHSAISK